MDDDTSLVRLLDSVISELTVRARAELVKMKAILSLDSALTTLFNPSRLNGHRASMHLSGVKADSAFGTKRSASAALRGSLLSVHSFGKVSIAWNVPIIVASNNNITA